MINQPVHPTNSHDDPHKAGEPHRGGRRYERGSPRPVGPRLAPFTLDLGGHDGLNRASAEGDLAGLRAERSDVEARLSTARARLRAAQELLDRAADAREHLGALMVAAQREADRIQSEHRRVVAEVQADAEREAAHVIASAQAEAAAMRTMAHRILSRRDPVTATPA